jgi:hypothetical protein
MYASYIFGKAAAATVIAEAAVGDLGWLTVKSQIMDATIIRLPFPPA